MVNDASLCRPDHRRGGNEQGLETRVLISDETDAVLETGGGLLKARPLLEGKDPLITLNVDILTNLNLNKLLEFHTKHKTADLLRRYQQANIPLFPVRRG